MTTLPADPPVAVPRSAPQSLLYRRWWRWHFYAGLLCLPLLLLLAVTGAMYVFHREIDDVVYRDLLIRGAPRPGPMLGPERLIGAAIARVPGQPLAVTWPADPRHTVQVDVLGPDGARQVFVDPVTGRVQGDAAAGRRLMTLVKRVHSLAIAGPAGQAAIEVAAGALILLAFSGTWLWWPRGHRGVFTIRAGARGRTWWRDLHAVTGAYAGIVLVFLALTGMPWSVFWGHYVNGWLTAHDLGIPAQVWRDVPRSATPAGALGDVPWTHERQLLPRSTGTGTGAIGADAIARRLLERDMIAGVRLSLPLAPDGVYTAMRAHGASARQRTIHFDQYTGSVLADIGADDYAPLGRAIEWGIGVHQGEEYGRANQLAMFAACVALVALCVSGVTMWWRRRPRGRLAAPRKHAGERLPPAMRGVAIGLGVAFPLLGAAWLAALLLDRCLPRSWWRRFES